MLNYSSFSRASLITEPFRYAVIDSLLSNEIIEELLRNLPVANSYRSIRETGSDKTYNVVNNLLLELGAKEYNKKCLLNQSWINLIKSLQSEKYKKLLSDLLQKNLSECYQEITLKKYVYGDFISPHTDKDCVRATHLIFLNAVWDENWGGNLCFMESSEKIFQKFLPTREISVAFVRAENSWHSVDPVKAKTAERIALQVAFWNIGEKQVLPGRIEKAIKNKQQIT